MRFIVFFSLLFSFSATQAQKHYKVIAYISGDSAISAEGIDAKKLTHIHYTFASIEQGEISVGPNDLQNLAVLNSLKTVSPKLKVLVSLGGPNGSAGYVQATASDSSRNRLAASIVRFLSSKQLDGIEIYCDLKPRGRFGNAFNPHDQKNLVLLLEVLRQQLDAQSKAEGRKKKKAYLLCMTGSSRRQYLFHSQLHVAHKYLDYITLQTFDYKIQILNAGGISSMLVSNHHSNLYTSRLDSWFRFSVDKTVKEYIDHNIPSRKLVMGINLSGQGWNNTYEEYNGLYQWAESKITDDLSYKAIASNYKEQADYQHFWDKHAKARFIYNKKNGVFISYDDKRTIRKKTLYVRRHRMSGVIFGDYRQDDGTLLKPIKNGMRFIRLPFVFF